MSGLIRAAIKRAIPEVRNGAQVGPLLAASSAFPEAMTRAILTGADFAANSPDKQFHTSDYKLTAFESNTMGADLTWYLRSLGRKRASLDFLANSSVSLLYFHYFNNAQGGRFSCDVVQTRIGFSY